MTENKKEILENFLIGELENPITLASIAQKMEQWDMREACLVMASKKNLIEGEKEYLKEFPLLCREEETDMDDDS